MDASARPPEQLNISFDTSNPLAAKLRHGEFCVLIEYDTPPQSQPFKPSIAIGQTMARRLRDLPSVTGLAVTDRARVEAAHDPVETAMILAESSAKPVLMHLSGKGSGVDRIRSLLARASSAGIRSLLAVTGDRSDLDPGRNQSGRRLPYPAGYLDSVRILQLARSSSLPLYLGAGVNPYKYDAVDQFLQYHKMVRKLASGAQFLVTHFGWDMRKLQELQWFLQMREIGNPVLARIQLLSLDDIRGLRAQVAPGIHISRALAATLQREASVNATQCLAAQLNRIGLQVAGCKLLGYSGVQLGGIRDAKTLDMVISRVDDALRQYRTYNAWLAAWAEFHGDLELAPRQGAYHAFTPLLTQDRALYSQETCKSTGYRLPEPSGHDKARSVALSLLLSRRAPAFLQRLTRSALCSRCGELDCQLQYCFYLCADDCPKRLTAGACGGSEPDGTCEFGHQTCFHHRVLALANWRHALDRMEEEIHCA